MSEIVRIWNSSKVRIRENDRYVCLSDIAKASGKKFAKWFENDSTHRYLQVVEQGVGIRIAELVERNVGKPTFAHPKVALRFSQWCSEELAYQVDCWLDELLTTGSVSIVKPKTALELAKEQVKLLEKIELQKEQIKILEDDNDRQAEIIDELFDYSSIVRVAKYNQCDEKAFKWHALKSASNVLGLKIKKAPCPRFTTKNLYHHDAWRLAYPNYNLPETTTIKVIKS